MGFSSLTHVSKYSQSQSIWTITTWIILSIETTHRYICGVSAETSTFPVTWSKENKSCRNKSRPQLGKHFSWLLCHPSTLIINMHVQNTQTAQFNAETSRPFTFLTFVKHVKHWNAFTCWWLKQHNEDIIPWRLFLTLISLVIRKQWGNCERRVYPVQLSF